MAKRHRWDADYASDDELKKIEADLNVEIDAALAADDTDEADTDELAEYLELPQRPQDTPGEFKKS